MLSLLDPSCSGSGIVNRLDYLVEDGQSFSAVKTDIRDIMLTIRKHRRDRCES